MFSKKLTKGFNLVCLVLGLLSGGSPAQADINSGVIYLSPDPLLVKGEKAFFVGDYNESINLLTKGLKKSLSKEQEVSVYNALCAAEYKLGNWDKAHGYCTKAISQDQHYWRAYVNRGNIFKALGNKIKAYENYCRAREIAPKKVTGSFTKFCKSF
jgi:tetratricopeptide (TPR) repeat protein